MCTSKDDTVLLLILYSNIKFQLMLFLRSAEPFIVHWFARVE